MAYSYSHCILHLCIMLKTKADENSLSLSQQVAITQKNTKKARLWVILMWKNSKITVSQICGKNFMHAQTAETRCSFHYRAPPLAVNAEYKAIDLFSFNSHLVQSWLNFDVTPIIAYTGYTPWRERATVAQLL